MIKDNKRIMFYYSATNLETFPLTNVLELDSMDSAMHHIGIAMVLTIQRRVLYI